MMTRKDMRLLLCVAEWTAQNQRNVMSTIRELAGTEENYLIIARELDRVNVHIARAIPPYQGDPDAGRVACHCGRSSMEMCVLSGEAI